MSKTYTTSELAKLLGISRQVVLRFCQTGEINCIRNYNGYFIIFKDEADRQMELFQVGKQYFTIRQVADITGLEVQKLLRWIKENVIDAVCLPTSKYVLLEKEFDRLFKALHSAPYTVPLKVWVKNYKLEE